MTPMRRIALVIANAEYRHARRLRNTHADAAAMAAALAQAGFQSHTKCGGNIAKPLTVMMDLSLIEMKRALADFGEAAHGAEMAAIYYSGHGMEIHSRNFLIPIDAEIPHVSRVAHETIRLSETIEATLGASKLRLVIVDACRDNPFLEKMNGVDVGKGGHAGLAPPRLTGSAWVFYAATEGQVAREGPEGGVSPFAYALSQRLVEHDRELFRILGKVTEDVRHATDEVQEPRFYGAPPGDDIYLFAKNPEHGPSSLQVGWTDLAPQAPTALSIPNSASKGQRIGPFQMAAIALVLSSAVITAYLFRATRVSLPPPQHGATAGPELKSVTSNPTNTRLALGGFIEGTPTDKTILIALFGNYDSANNSSTWRITDQKLIEMFKEGSSGLGESEPVESHIVWSKYYKDGLEDKLAVLWLTGGGSCEACWGVAGLSVFHKISGGWQMAAEEQRLSLGEHAGRPPDFDLVQIGRERFGFVGRSVTLPDDWLSGVKNVGSTVQQKEFVLLEEHNTSFTQLISFDDDLGFESGPFFSFVVGSNDEYYDLRMSGSEKASGGIVNLGGDEVGPVVYTYSICNGVYLNRTLTKKGRAFPSEWFNCK